MDVKIEASWKQALIAEFDKDYFIKLTDLSLIHISEPTRRS